MIRGSINLPAQSLYHTIPVVYRLSKAASLAKVILVCGKLKISHLESFLDVSVLENNLN